MNTQPTSHKTWIWATVIVIAAAIGYFYFYGNSASTPSTLLSSSPTSDSAIVGAQVLGLLNQIQSLKIDTSIFTDPGYNTLRDYSVAIPPVNVGRPNPFAPLPGFSNTAPAPTH